MQQKIKCPCHLLQAALFQTLKSTIKKVLRLYNRQKPNLLLESENVPNILWELDVFKKKKWEKIRCSIQNREKSKVVYSKNSKWIKISEKHFIKALIVKQVLKIFHRDCASTYHHAKSTNLDSQFLIIHHFCFVILLHHIVYQIDHFRYALCKHYVLKKNSSTQNNITRPQICGPKKCL